MKISRRKLRDRIVQRGCDHLVVVNPPETPPNKCDKDYTMGYEDAMIMVLKEINTAKEEG